MPSQLNRGLSPGLVVVPLTVVAFGLIACDEPNHPAAPQGGAPVQAPVVSARLRAAPEMFEDAASRLLPSFSDESRALELRARLEDFSSAYAAGNDAAARAALTSARSLLEKGGAHAANLSALRLAIGRAEALMDSTTAAEVSRD